MGELAQALIARGYNPTDAANAENGPRAAELAREYLGTGGGGSSGGNYSAPAVMSIDQIINNAVGYVTGLIKEPPKPYEEVNPFFFDEALAREASTAEYTPYYQELVTDYANKVQKTISRSNEDLNKTLAYLSKTKEEFLGDERRNLDAANRSTNEGYAGRGLYFSGERQRKLGEIGEASQSRIGEYETGYGRNVEQQQTGNQRTLTDVTEGQNLYNRDIERQKLAAIEGGILNRKGEVQEEYLAGMNKYYQN